VPTLVTALMHCTSCDGERAFEQPDCVDGHGGDCPDWVCAECGAGVVTAVIATTSRESPATLRRSA
jgi:hypothetical protein